MENVKSSSKELESLSKEMFEALSKGDITFREAFDIPKEKLEAMYSLAYNLYVSDKYEKAEKIFNALCLYDPLKVDYWVGLGACNKMLKRYKEATIAYHSILNLDPTHVASYLDMAECLMHSKQHQAAKKFLEVILAIPKENKMFSAAVNLSVILQKAKLMHHACCGSD